MTVYKYHLVGLHTTADYVFSLHLYSAHYYLSHGLCVKSHYTAHLEGVPARRSLLRGGLLHPPARCGHCSGSCGLFEGERAWLDWRVGQRGPRKLFVS